MLRTVRGGGHSSEDEDEPPLSETPDAETHVVRLSLDFKGLFLRVLSAVGNLLGVGGGGGGTGIARKPALANGNFREEFEATYGKRHPIFSEKSFRDTTQLAWSRNRLCLVYIAAEDRGRKSRQADKAICEALADPQVASYVDENFLMWVPNGKSRAQRSSSGAAAAKRVGAKSLPFLGVVHASSSPDKLTQEPKLKCSTVALHHCNPPPSARQMVSWMTRVLELQKDALAAQRAELKRLKDESAIARERVQGYSQSIKDDSLREAREAEEEAERARLKEEEDRLQEALEAKRAEDAERRRRKEADLGEEPPEMGPETSTSASTSTSTIMLRLADGSRVRRRFLRSDKIGRVLDWADVHGVDLESQRLASSSPKATFSYPGDSSLTIEGAGLRRQTLLFVEQKLKEASSAPAKERGQRTAETPRAGEDV